MKTTRFSVPLIALLASCVPMTDQADIRIENDQHEHHFVQDDRGRTMPATMILFSEENPPQAIPAVETSRPTVPVMALAVNLRNTLPEASRLIHKSIWMRIRSPTGKGV